jgi:hypothetical protein
MDKYKETFYLQMRRTELSGYDFPDMFIRPYTDIGEVKGVYVSDGQRGRFLVQGEASLVSGDVLRRACDNLFIKIVGQPRISPKAAVSQFKAYNAEVLDE